MISYLNNFFLLFLFSFFARSTWFWFRRHVTKPLGEPQLLPSNTRRYNKTELENGKCIENVFFPHVTDRTCFIPLKFCAIKMTYDSIDKLQTSTEVRNKQQ